MVVQDGLQRKVGAVAYHTQNIGLADVVEQLRSAPQLVPEFTRFLHQNDASSIDAVNHLDQHIYLSRIVDLAAQRAVIRSLSLHVLQHAHLGFRRTAAVGKLEQLA